MSTEALSSAETKYILEGVSIELRSDGRGLDDLRALTIENNIFPHVNGSSRLRIGLGTEILCVVKMEVVPPLESCPEHGIIGINVDISPSCDRYLKIRNDKRNEDATNLSDLLETMYSDSKAINKEDLVIVKGKYCWACYIDIIILKADCSLLDATSIATYIALKSTRIPKTELIVGETGQLDDFEVIGDLAEANPLSCDYLPLVITSLKLGQKWLLDGTWDEVSCASSQLAILIDEAGNIRGLNKLLGGSLGRTDITSVLNMTKKASKSIFPQIIKAIENCANQANDGLYADVPPIRKGLLIPNTTM